jgi:hypothetical protein
LSQQWAWGWRQRQQRGRCRQPLQAQQAAFKQKGHLFGYGAVENRKPMACVGVLIETSSESF